MGEDAPVPTKGVVVIVGSPRSGTLMVRTALSRHPALRSLNDILNFGPRSTCSPRALEIARIVWQQRPGELRFGLPGHDGSVVAHPPRPVAPFATVSRGFATAHVRDSPLLHRYLRRALQPGHLCRIQYNQLPPFWVSAWKKILAIENLRLIHVVRHNVLDIAVSGQAAANANRWWHGADEPPIIDDAPFSMDPDVLADIFTSVKQSVDTVRFFVDAAQGIEVSYDDLVGNWETEIRRIQDFVGVEPRPLVAATGKRTARKPRELLANYSDLEAVFSSSPWKVLFTE